MKSIPSFAKFSETAQPDLHSERYRLWLLKNSCFLKTARFWETENVCQNGDRRLESFLLQSFFDHFPVSAFFNTHA